MENMVSIGVCILLGKEKAMCRYVQCREITLTRIIMTRFPKPGPPTESMQMFMGLSAFMIIPHFYRVQGFIVDYIHCIDLES